MSVKKAEGAIAVFWVPCAADSQAGKKLKAQGDLVLPFLLRGEAAERLKAGGAAQATEEDLLLGLLTEYFTPPPFAESRGINPCFRDMSLMLLEEYRCRYGYDSIEGCLLGISEDLIKDREKALSRRVLQAGCAILPESEAIRNALAGGKD